MKRSFEIIALVDRDLSMLFGHGYRLAYYAGVYHYLFTRTSRNGHLISQDSHTLL